MGYYVKNTEEYGRGVYARQKHFSDSLVEVCELLVLSQIDTPIVNSTDLKYYTFKYNENQDCLVLGIGEIFNHSDTPNVKYELKDIGGRKMMVFTALRTIEQDEQMFIDYNSDVEVDTSKYTVNLVK